MLGISLIFLGFSLLLFYACILFLSCLMMVNLTEKACIYLSYYCCYCVTIYVLSLFASAVFTVTNRQVCFFRHKRYLSIETEKCYCASKRFCKSLTDVRSCYICSLKNLGVRKRVCVSCAYIVVCSNDITETGLEVCSTQRIKS